MSAEAAFAEALIAHLRAEAEMKTRFGDPARIYDRAPRGAACPFVSLGQGVSEPIDADGADLIAHRLSVHVWERREDREALRDAVAALRAATHHADLSLAAPYACPLLRVVYVDVFSAPDARTLHGIVRLRAVLERN